MAKHISNTGAESAESQVYTSVPEIDESSSVLAATTATIVVAEEVEHCTPTSAGAINSSPLAVAVPVPPSLDECSQEHQRGLPDSDAVGMGLESDPDYFKVRAPVAIPENMTVTYDEHGGGLMIERRWFTPKVYEEVKFALLWNCPILLTEFMVISDGGKSSSDADNLPLLWFILLIFNALGVLQTYRIVVIFRNSTIVTVRGSSVKVESRPHARPITWARPPAPFLDARRIEKIRCKRTCSHETQSGRHYHYDVRALDANSIETVLVNNLSSLEEAIFLAQKLERYLGLGDVPSGVDGFLP